MSDAANVVLDAANFLNLSPSRSESTLPEKITGPAVRYS
jgi:hypothetical protein